MAAFIGVKSCRYKKLVTSKELHSGESTGIASIVPFPVVRSTAHFSNIVGSKSHVWGLYYISLSFAVILVAGNPNRPKLLKNALINVIAFDT